MIRDCVAEFWRSLPVFRGHGRLALWMNRAFLAAGQEPEVITPMRLGHRMMVDLRSLQGRAYWSGRYDDKALQSILGIVQDDWVALDVGANIGFYTVPLARAVSRVHAFEPVPANHDRLLVNLAMNGVTAEVFPFGLSSVNEMAKLTLREEFLAGAKTFNASVLIEDGADDEFETIDITLRRFDDVAREHGIDRVDFIKADLEGHEDLFLEGAQNTLTKSRPIIFTEINKYFLDRRGVVLDERIPAVLPDGYCAVSLSCDKIESFDSFAGIENIFIAPFEKLSAVQEAISSVR